jgi:P-type Ca2+ transporter type 2C
MSLGVDPVSPDAMRRPPRPARERILTRPRLLRILLASAVMAVGTLAVLATAPGPEPQLGVATVAGTMAFVTFVFFQAFNLLNVRDDTRSVFNRGNPAEPHRVRRHRRRRRTTRPHRPGRRPARILHHH